MKNMKRIIVIFIAFVMVFTLAACGNSNDSGSGSAPSSGGTSSESGDTSGGSEQGGTINIVYGDTTEPFGLPWLMLSGSGHAGTVIGECLVMEHFDGSIEPWLAESYEIDIDAGEIRFKLREGIKFHDGSDFNAEVVGWNFQQFIDNNVLSPAISGYEVRGEYEVAVTFNIYSAAVLSMLAAHTHQFVSKENYDKNGQEYAMQNMVGTGPFKLVSFTPGGECVVERNENYWREGEPYLDKIVFQNLTDTMSQTLAVQTKGSSGIDILYSSNPEQVVTLRDSAPVNVLTIPNGAITIFPSSSDPNSPLSKLEVRQAVNYAINRDPLLQARGFGLLQPAYQFIPDIYSGHLPESDEIPHYDPEKAKELLAEAGYPNGFKTTLIAEYGLTDQDFVVALASQLAEVGIECELEFPTQAASNDYRMNGGFDGMLVSRLTTFTAIYLTFYLMGMDPTNADQFHPATWRPNDQEAIDLFHAVRSDLTGDSSIPAAFHKLMLDNMVNIPLYYTAEYWVIKDDVSGGGMGEYAGGVDWAPGEIQLSR